MATGRSDTLCAALADQGFEVHRLELSTGPLPKRFGPIDAIVHTAGLSSPWGAWANFKAANVDATQNMVEAAKRMGVSRFVNISTPSVYFVLRDQMDVAETHPLPTPYNAYARSKAEAERLVLSTPEIGPVSLRPRGIYGSGDSALLPRLLRAAQTHPLPVFRGGRARIDLTHVSDVCAAVEAALLAGPVAVGETFNISGGEVLPVRHIIDTACARSGVDPRWRRVPFRPALGVAKLQESLAALSAQGKEPKFTSYALALLAFEQSLNIDKAARLLGWTPKVRFDDGVEEALGKGRQK